MKYDFKLEVMEIFRLSVGYNCLICCIDSENHQLIPSGSSGKIIIEGVLEKKLSSVGENVFRSNKMHDENKTVLVTKDNIDDILEFVGKKKIYIEGSFSDEGKSEKNFR